MVHIIVEPARSLDIFCGWHQGYAICYITSLKRRQREDKDWQAIFFYCLEKAAILLVLGVCLVGP